LTLTAVFVLLLVLSGRVFDYNGVLLMALGRVYCPGQTIQLTYLPSNELNASMQGVCCHWTHSLVNICTIKKLDWSIW